MKKLLLILGIILIIAGVIALALSGLFFYARVHTLDGSAGLYDKQTGMAFTALAIGLVLLAAGIVCIVCRTKL